MTFEERYRTERQKRIETDAMIHAQTLLGVTYKDLSQTLGRSVPSLTKATARHRNRLADRANESYKHLVRPDIPDDIRWLHKQGWNAQQIHSKLSGYTLKQVSDFVDRLPSMRRDFIYSGDVA